MRQKLVELVCQLGHEVVEYGPVNELASPVDYPDVAVEVAREVSLGLADRGILICGTGIGMCITANKFPHVRAAPIVDELTAEISRRHNDLNVICFSGDMLSDKMVSKLLEIWLTTPFDGGRHARRMEKISEIERSLMENGGDVSKIPTHGSE